VDLLFGPMSEARTKRAFGVKRGRWDGNRRKGKSMTFYVAKQTAFSLSLFLKL
jgi:hypothetical protein